jgi:hypothetical protein
VKQVRSAGLAGQCILREEELIARILCQRRGRVVTVLRESAPDEPSGPFYSFLESETDNIWHINVGTRSPSAWSFGIGRIAKQAIHAVPSLRICEASVPEGEVRCFRVSELMDGKLVDRSRVFTRGVPPQIELGSNHRTILSVTRCRLVVQVSLDMKGAHLHRCGMLGGTARLAGTSETFPILLIPVRRSITLTAETQAMDGHKASVAIPVTLSLGEFEVSLSELVALREGTSLSIPSDVTFEGALLIGGERYAKASINCVDGTFVVTVTDILPDRSASTGYVATPQPTRGSQGSQNFTKLRNQGNILLDRPID